MKKRSQSKNQTAEDLGEVSAEEALENKPEAKKNKNKKNTSLRLDKQTLKALKIRAIQQETSIQKLIETLINDYLEKSNHS